MSNLPSIPEKQIEVAKKLNEKIGSILGNDALMGFERAFQVSSAIQDLKNLLTPEYMKPIMALQGNKLGFKTDKDKTGGYPEEIVKTCLIEAVLTGFEPTGNQWNIISGSMYGTKEGFGAVLNKIKGLEQDIVPTLPRMNQARDGAAVLMKIKWTYQGKTEEKEIEFAVKLDPTYGTVDAAVGKATRKARAWLFNKINGTDVGEADVLDADFKVMPAKAIAMSTEEKERERISLLITDSSSVADLMKHEKHVLKDPELRKAFDDHRLMLETLAK